MTYDPEKKRQYYLANRERLLEYQRQRRAINPGINREYQREWRKNNKQRRRLEAASRYRKNSERMSAVSRDWRRRNREVVAGYTQKRRAVALAAPGLGISRVERAEIMSLACGLCVYCGKRVSRLVLDHIEPLARGGAHDPSNAVAACVSCNSAKNTRPLIAWLVERAARCRK